MEHIRYSVAACQTDMPNPIDRRQMRSNTDRILRMVDAEITPYEFAKRAASAFFLSPKLLLDESINRPLLANLVQHDLFQGNQGGWESYVSELQQQVPWFAAGLEEVPDEQSEKSVAVWPPSTH